MTLEGNGMYKHQINLGFLRQYKANKEIMDCVSECVWMVVYACTCTWSSDYELTQP